jgi:hypothetical protein
MDQHEASRTLVKSPPELWMACSDEESLSRHLNAFGEIRITRREPEKTVAWEGDAVCGTVEIEPSGWGTRVTLRARSTAPEPPVVEEPEPESEPEPQPEPLAEQEHEVTRASVWQRLFSRRRPVPVSVAPEPVSVAPEAADSAPPPADPPDPEPPGVDTAAVLDAALDSLGQAHHRPFSRA